MIDRILDSRSLTPDRFDWRFLGLIAAILSLGVLSIYSVTSVQAVAGTPMYLKQLAWIAIGCVAFVAMLIVDYHKISRFAYVLYALLLVLLVVVLVAGKTSRGAQRWIPIGPFVFQPSEFAKLVLVLTLATYYTKSPRQGWMQRVVLPGLIMLPGLLLILKQPDLGSGLSYLSI
ncbi:MAG: FtsW/RodA/SpoVE family cell cycle protein, partial [Nitrospirota bacterium]